MSPSRRLARACVQAAAVRGVRAGVGAPSAGRFVGFEGARAYYNSIQLYFYPRYSNIYTWYFILYAYTICSVRAVWAEFKVYSMTSSSTVLLLY